MNASIINPHPEYYGPAPIILREENKRWHLFMLAAVMERVPLEHPTQHISGKMKPSGIEYREQADVRAAYSADVDPDLSSYDTIVTSMRLALKAQAKTTWYQKYGKGLFQQATTLAELRYKLLVAYHAARLKGGYSMNLINRIQAVLAITPDYVSYMVELELECHGLLYRLTFMPTDLVETKVAVFKGAIYKSLDCDPTASLELLVNDLAQKKNFLLTALPRKSLIGHERGTTGQYEVHRESVAKLLPILRTTPTSVEEIRKLLAVYDKYMIPKAQKKGRKDGNP